MIATLSFACSAILTFAIIRLATAYKLAYDPVSGELRKVHVQPVPRIGGVGILIGLLASGIVLHSGEYWILLGAALPAFYGGIKEDVTKRAGVLKRLGLSMGSAALGIVGLGAFVSRIDLPWVDQFMALPLIAWLFTIVAVAGIAHALNIIDGFNGLASGTSLIILSALGYVAYLVGDQTLFYACLAAVGAIFGFFVWNFPHGKIFLGDGGAYLLGFLIAEISVLLVQRNPEVSAWFPMLLVAYPVTETLFSVYRRKFKKGISPGRPDGVHLHTLIYQRLVRWKVGSKNLKDQTVRNALTSLYLWGFTLLCALPAILFWQNTPVLIGAVAAFVFVYLGFYRRLVRFKMPRWLIIRREVERPVASVSYAQVRRVKESYVNGHTVEAEEEWVSEKRKVA